MALADQKLAVIEAGRRLGAKGLVVAAEGNISVRIAPDRFLITATGRRKDSLTSDDLVAAWLDPEHDKPFGDGPRPSSDIAIHRAIYRARPDVAAIIHAHVPAAMALTLAGLAPDPPSLPETALLLPNLPVVEFATPGSQELAQLVASALESSGGRTMDARAAETSDRSAASATNAVLLERHGAIAVGPDLTTAADRMELVDVLCRVYRDAALLRVTLDGGLHDRPLPP
jgi:L-fuculose-phosphate aldolase